MNLDRWGTMVEASYAVAAALPFGITQLTPKLRGDFAGQDALSTSGLPEGFRSAIYSVGTTLSPHSRTQLSIEYHFRRERDRSLANDRFVVRFSAEF